MPANISYLVREAKRTQGEIDELRERKNLLCGEISCQLGVKEAIQVLTEAGIRFHVKLVFVGTQLSPMIVTL